MAAYDYLMLSLARGPAARSRFVEAVAASGLAAVGAKALGLFTPQLGWEAAQAALLVERGAAGGVAEAVWTLSRTPDVLDCQFHELAPTVRPAPGGTPEPGGIWVHRWFEVEGASFDAFVALSAEAWPDFEGRFDARIFGLFEDVSHRPGDGRRRLLLITRYGDHGVWEASRDPTTEAMQTFARRAALTLSTRAASTLLTAL